MNSQSQTLAVQLFARARDLARAASVSVRLPEGATVLMLRRALAAQHPALAGFIDRCAVAVDDDFAPDDLPIPANAALALIPPVSGGM